MTPSSPIPPVHRAEQRDDVLWGSPERGFVRVSQEQADWLTRNVTGQFQRVVLFWGKPVASGPITEEDAQEQVEAHKKHGYEAWVETRTVTEWRRS